MNINYPASDQIKKMSIEQLCQAYPIQHILPSSYFVGTIKDGDTPELWGIAYDNIFLVSIPNHAYKKSTDTFNIHYWADLDITVRKLERS